MGRISVQTNVQNALKKHRMLLTELEREIDNSNERSAELLLREALPNTPMRSGELRRTARVMRFERGIYATVFKRPDDGTAQGSDIAVNAETGTTSSGRRISKWTTSGTGPRYMENAVEKLKPQFDNLANIAIKNAIVKSL